MNKRCRNCNEYLRGSLAGSYTTCKKCYMDFKRNERKEKGLKWNININIIVNVNLIRCKGVLILKVDVPIANRRF